MSEKITALKDGQQVTGSLAQSFLYNVFTYMFAALAITGVVSFWFGTNMDLMDYLRNPETRAMTTIGWVVLLAPLGFVLLMNRGFNRYSSLTLLLMFIAFATLMGMSLSFIFLRYTDSSIASTFGITSLTFGTMAVVGYTTKTDLTKFGSILMMGLVGIIIAMVINWFMQSAMMDWIISGIGVLIFTGLTAYDVQKLKRIGAGVEYGSESTNKLAIMGALSLYLDFINLFLFLLRFMGNRR